ncbi:MAG TPA: hemerythrin domain-containing protein [Polyangiaceae bacterium]|nr:hemerythrin domain-containing protein [Polyangiaceae bacterium]
MSSEKASKNGAVQARTDFYTMVHKGIRQRLFEAVILAGTVDFQDAGAGAKIVSMLTILAREVREHAGHEETFIHPVLAEVMPDMAASLHAGHEEHDRALDEVERAFEVAAAQRTAASGHLAYRALARFVAMFLTHTEEEEAMQPLLWDRVSEERLAAVMAAFWRSRKPAQAPLVDHA